DPLTGGAKKVNLTARLKRKDLQHPGFPWQDHLTLPHDIEYDFRIRYLSLHISLWHVFVNPC
ncbi:hypothetical protein ACFLVC_02760, partial [Chloroflexota bacterium]